MSLKSWIEVYSEFKSAEHEWINDPQNKEKKARSQALRRECDVHPDRPPGPPAPPTTPDRPKGYA